MLSLLHATLLRHKGNRARDARDWSAAKADYAALLKLRPSKAEIWVQYGHAAKESGDLSGAESAYRQALSLAPHHADTHLQLGHVLKMMGRFGEAEQSYRQALSLDFSKADTHLQLGHLLKEDGRLAEAELAYCDALERAPSSTSARVELNTVKRKTKALKRPKGVPTHLRYVNIGTTGLCNASCFSCPTGKTETDHVPRVPMPMALFEKLIHSMVDLELVITNQISFGLFGDSLIDPFVVERAKLVRSLMPDAQLVVNTNGAAYNSKRHKELFEYISYLALHVESLVPETYHKLMHPLRAERVFPKVEQILEDFRGKVLTSTPVSKLNVDELPAMKQYFSNKGALEVVFDPVSSRCAENQEKFRSLALNPVLIQCPPEILEDIIIDCDGQVLVCCQDFQRLEPIGNLAEQSLAEVLTDARRVAMRDRFDQGRHHEMKTCARCYADAREPTRESQNTGPLYQADLARKERAWPQAKALYWEALQRQPGRPDIWIQYGNMSRETGDLKEAEAAYRRAISLNAADAEAHVQLGHLLKFMGRRDEAASAYSKAVDHATNQAATGNALSLQMKWLYQAAREINAGNWSGAKVAYGEFLRLQPGRDDVWVQYGHCAKESGDLEEAESAYRKALCLDPSNSDTHLQLGHALKLMRRLAEAEQAYATALSCDPSSADARNELAAITDHA